MKRIGIFDSGIGGLTIVPHLLNLGIECDIDYFADSECVPYGSKSEEFIVNRSLAICNYLLKRGADVIVIACNTATALAVEYLRSKLTVTIIGIEPGIKPALAVSQNKRIAVLATSNTLASKRYANLLSRYVKEDAYTLIPISGTGLVELAEELQFGFHPLLEHYLNQCFEGKVDTLVLGCTHYSFFNEAIRNHLKHCKKEVTVIDTSVAVARHIVSVTSNLNELKKSVSPYVAIATSGCEKNLAKAAQFLMIVPNECATVNLENHK